MKIIKRIAAIMLAICLIVPCFSMVAEAAEGVIFFTDLETKVGDTFEITGTVVSKGGTLADVSVKMTYDTSYMRFVSGDGVNAESEGALTFTGTGTSDRLEFVMTFQALQEGTTRLVQNEAEVTTTNGDAVECTNGYSDVAIGAGDPSLINEAGNTKEITIDGQLYTISEAFSDNEIPAGFTAGEFTYEDGNYKGAVQETSGLVMAYLVDANQAGKFWMYDSQDTTFSPCEEIIISDEYSIIVYDGTKDVKLSEKYEKSTMEINGNSFPVWSEPNRDGFYILYAVNNEGDKSLYLYDSLEHTYQRMETPKAATEKASATGLWSKISDFLTDYLVWFVVIISCILIVLIIFLIVLAIKLHHRNMELDDLYDEYGIDAAHEPVPAVQGKNKSEFRKVYEEDDYDDFYEDDDYYEDDDDDLADLREDFGSLKSERNYDDYYDDDDFDDGYDEPSTKDKKLKEDDTFSMDFIDLD